MPLPTDRTTSNTAAEHVADHNAIHGQHNAYEGKKGVVVQNDAPTSPATNDLWLDADEAAASGGSTAAWSDYTPALTAATTNPTLGTGAVTAGRYVENGKTITGWASIDFGTSGTDAGSGRYRISLPVAAASHARYRIIGSGIVYVGSLRVVVARIDASITTYLEMYLEGSLFVEHNNPGPFGVGSTILVNFTYEAA